ncbi:hypothetical protein GGX14DRAFT_561025 [Mycena pura]|uniref:Uncharacterized protein n=1 Tax=Mycena pura TaxID=153505 RepID=A0AAD6VP37_9AGAR|nr:hypothetical protein GGX14DRAFT_561025 [Mycena pura]
MPSKTLVKALALAQDMRKHCETTPHLSLYQPAAASAAEVCVSAALVTSRNTASLAAYAVKKTAGLIDIGAEQPHSGEIPFSGLHTDDVDRALDMMRARLDFEDTLDQQRAKISKALDVANSDSALEVASVGILAASAICDAPVLNFLKPALGTVALYTVQGNRQSAVELANLARNVTAHVVDLAAPGCEDAMAPLCSLRQRRRVASCQCAPGNDRFARLNGALDKALDVSTSEVVKMAAVFRNNDKQLTAIVETLHRLEYKPRQTSITHFPVSGDAGGDTDLPSQY